MVQDKQEAASSKKKYVFSRLVFFVKGVLTILIFFYIYTSLLKDGLGFSDLKEMITRLLTRENTWAILVLILLCPVNWLLESLKWQLLAGKVVRMSLVEAVRGTLAGLAVGVAMPAQLGDTIGRIATIRSKSKLMAVGPALISNGIQFYVSLLFGTICFFELRHRLPISKQYADLFLMGLTGLLCLGVVITVYRRSLTHWRVNLRFLEKFRPNIEVMGTYSGSEIGRALGIGVVRYLTFMAQFVIALSLLDFQVGMADLLYCTGVIFLAKTLIPALNIFGDLGMREFTALVVFQSYEVTALQVVTATFLVWLVNILGPVLIGLFMIWKRHYGATAAES